MIAGEYLLQPEWIVNILVPLEIVDIFTNTLGEKVPLIRGGNSHCMYIRNNGYYKFKRDMEVYATQEERIQKVMSAEIVISMPREIEFLEQILDVVRQHHVCEEPVINITESLGLRLPNSFEVEIPNKYWNHNGDIESSELPKHYIRPSSKI